jgi:hypothetical protein
MNVSAACGAEEDAIDTLGFAAYIPNMNLCSVFKLQESALTRITAISSDDDERRKHAALQNVSGKARAILMTKTVSEDTT